MHAKDEDSLSPSEPQMKTPHSVKERKQAVVKKEVSAEDGRPAEHRSYRGTYFQERPHQCEVCGKAFTSLPHLKMHLLSHTEGPYVSGVCTKAFPRRQSLTVHEKLDSGEKPFPCGFCEKGFRTSSSRYRHQHYWHRSAGDRCPHCDFKAVSFAFLLSHIQKLHTKESPSTSDVQPSTLLQPQQITTQEGTVVSVKMEVEEDSDGRLAEHPSTSFQENEFCQSEQSLGMPSLTERFHSRRKPFRCFFCEKRFRTSSSRHRHQCYWHPSAGDRHACPHCRFKAVCSSRLLSHVRIFHPRDDSETPEAVVGVKKEVGKDDSKHLLTNERPHLCQLCKKAFTSRQNLRMHFRNHTGERPYVCGTCGKAYTRKTYLTVHERFHSGERPYPCGSCSKSFTTSGDLKRHEMIHVRKLSEMLNDEGEGIQKYPATEKQSYQCELCDKTFIQKGKLKLHLRSHTGERPYVCDTCGKSFARRYYLTVHERYHSRERRYPCDFCSKSFTTSGDMNRHKKLHNRMWKSAAPSISRFQLKMKIGIQPNTEDQVDD